MPDDIRTTRMYDSETDATDIKRCIPPEVANSSQSRRERAESGLKTRLVSITASIN